MMTFDPDGGVQYGENAWVWPCGCAAVVRDAHMVVKACRPEHDEPLERVVVGTVRDARAELGQSAPEVNYVHPGVQLMAAYARPARLRELRRLERRAIALERERTAVVERQNRWLLDDQKAPDASSQRELAAALGLNEPALRQRLKRLRERLTA